MFDTVKVGKKIAGFRKENNMTQMELADNLGVSYQAVSNWERGNSMPDISKLPEICSLLGCSIDELLENENNGLIKHVVKGDVKDYIKEEQVTFHELAEAAPVLKPSQTQSLLETILEEQEERISLKDLLSMAPFVSEEYLLQWVNKADVNENIEDLIALAPFLSEEALDLLVKKLSGDIEMKKIVGLAPFLEEDSLNYLVMKCLHVNKLKELTTLAPFLEEDMLDNVIVYAIEQDKIEECIGLYPFLSEDTLKRVSDYFMRKGNFVAFKALAPFL
jgi:transcriptional regulator with XRE-family HTH domain